jgi:hypothetical protein
VERREGGWKKKIQRQGGKCRGEETDGMDRRKWKGGIEREQTRRRRMGMDLYRSQRRNSDRLWNSERRSMGTGRRIRIGERERERERETERAESDHLEIAVEEAKGRERTKKERGGE